MTQQPIPTDAPLTFRAGRALIELHRGVDCFSVLTIIGGRRVDDWSCTYRTEDEARTEARRAAKAFDQHGTDVAIAKAYDQARDLAEYWTKLRGSFAAAKAAEFRALADALQPLRGKAADADLIARMRASLGLAPLVQPLPADVRTSAWGAARQTYDAHQPSVN